MRTDWNENHAELVGEATAEPAFSHTNHGEDYYRLPLRVVRLSGSEDVVNLIVSRGLGTHSVNIRLNNQSQLVVVKLKGKMDQ